jgi:hypothetical protein
MDAHTSEDSVSLHKWQRPERSNRLHLGGTQETGILRWILMKAVVSELIDLAEDVV